MTENTEEISINPYNLETMPHLTKYAFISFISAKVIGIVGVVLGLIPGPIGILGGCLLAAAFILILASITMSIIQIRKNKKLFDNEDAEIKIINAIRNKKINLERELAELEERKKFILAFSGSYKKA